MAPVTRTIAVNIAIAKMKMRFLLMEFSKISGRKLLVKVFIIKPD
jgi:hypothetical protein